MTSRTGLRRALAISIAAGVLIAVLVLLAGGLYLQRRDTRYEATSSIVVLPDPALTPADTVSALDALSRGQVVATFGRVLGGQSLTTTALDTLGVPQSERANITSDFRVVANTSIVTATVSAPSRATAEAIAGEIATEAAATTESLQPLFVASVVDSGEGTAVPVGTSSSTIFLAFLAVAIVGGIVTQQLLFQGWSLLMASRERSRAASDPSTAPRANGDVGPEDSAWANDELLRTAQPVSTGSNSTAAAPRKSAGSPRTPSKRPRVAKRTDTTDVSAVDSGAGAPIESGGTPSAS